MPDDADHVLSNMYDGTVVKLMVGNYEKIEIAGKKKVFYVSAFSYSGYRQNETGTLRYRGDRIIDFH